MNSADLGCKIYMLNDESGRSLEVRVGYQKTRRISNRLRLTGSMDGKLRRRMAGDFPERRHSMPIQRGSS